MKILCVSPTYFPAFSFGGPITSLYNLNKELVKKGVDVTVYTTNLLLKDKVAVNQPVLVDGVKVTYFSYLRLFDFLGSSGWQYSRKMAKALQDNIRDFDLVYIVGIWNYPVTLAAHYCRKYNIPYIISLRGCLIPSMFKVFCWKKWPYFQLIAKSDINHASAIHYASDYEKAECINFFGFKNKAIVIPNGIDLSEFANLPDKGALSKRYPELKDKKVILYLGRISWLKGLDLLLRMFILLVQVRDDVHLLIAGDGNKKCLSELKDIVRLNSLSDKVTFTGWLSGKDKLEAFTGSDIFVLPSYSESFGMSLVEAMACGMVSVISEKVGICNAVVSRKAGICIDTNPENMCREINNLLNDSQLKGALSTKSVDFIKDHYDIGKIADEMLSFFTETLVTAKKQK